MKPAIGRIDPSSLAVRTSRSVSRIAATPYFSLAAARALGTG
jgi:hypothetical protein